MTENSRPATTAILCIARNETPFTEEWLEYHFSIGIDHIYYISTDVDFPRIEAFFEKSKFRSRVDLFYFNDFVRGWQIKCYNAHLPYVREDWVLVIDIDEFLCLNSYSNIQEYLKTVDPDTGQIQFPWLMLVSPKYHHNRTLDILNCTQSHISDHVKSMARNSKTDKLKIHSHVVGHSKSRMSSGREVPPQPHHEFLLKQTDYCKKHPFVWHFCSRGHLDVLIRIIDHQFFNSKNGPTEHKRLRSFLLAPADWSNIPNRFLLMLFYASLPNVRVNCTAPELEARTDVDDLKNIFLANIRKLIDFNVDDQASMEDQFENDYQLDQKLSPQDVMALSDPEEYLKCGSQLEYVEKLRQALKSGTIQ
jgi:hypothetical protein